MIDATPLKGKVALVTGGSRGIGKAISMRLADMGAKVCINFFKNRNAAEETLEEVKSKGGDALLLRANVGSQKSLNKMFDNIKNTIGTLDIFISNAALGRIGHIKDIDDEAWNFAMDTNAKALLFGAQKAAEIMTNGGNIVALGSLGVHRYIPGYSSIATSKAAIEVLVKYLAIEYHDKKINCNCVSGGLINTEALKGFPNYQEIHDEAVRRTLDGCVGQPDDLAGVVCFLCTPEAKWITGQTIVADGGYSIL